MTAISILQLFTKAVFYFKQSKQPVTLFMCQFLHERITQFLIKLIQGQEFQRMYLQPFQYIYFKQLDSSYINQVQVMDNLAHSPLQADLSYPFSSKVGHVRSDSTDDEVSLDYHTPKVVRTNICKYKTEMCKNFAENGFCPYRNKCQFAHGCHELHNDISYPKKTYRTKKCKSFWEQGICRYGLRCQFQHYDQQSVEHRNRLVLIRQMMKSKDQGHESKLIKIIEKDQSGGK